ncbi:MAG: hypothetical protein IKU82_04595 [Clostridia bacterium]|nr:hypothetical protein [Clostridia bacterium]
METPLAQKQKKFPWALLIGLLLQTPVLVTALLGAVNLLGDFLLSFTNADYISDTMIVGLENYLGILDFGIPIYNTVAFFVVVLVFCIGTIVSALFISKLKTIFGVLASVALAMFSFAAIFVNFSKVIFSSDSHGYINSVLLRLGILLRLRILDVPVMWLKEYGAAIYLALAIAAITAPVFIITYVFAKSGKKTVGVMTAVCAIPLLFTGTSNMALELLGYPSYHNAADWLPLFIKDFYFVHYEIGYASAAWIYLLIMYFVWCVVWCGIIFIWSIILRHIKLPQTPRKIIDYIIKIIGYILFAGTILKAVSFVLPNVIYSLNTSFKPLDELLIVPSSFFVKRPILSNYTTYFKLVSEVVGNIDITSVLLDLCAIVMVCLILLVPSAIGFAILKNKKVKIGLSFIFVPWIAFLPFSLSVQNQRLYSIYSFITGFGAVIVFLATYILTKSVMDAKKCKVAKIIGSAICVFSTIFFVGMASVNFVIPISNEINWITVNRMLTSGGIARAGSAMVGDALLCLFTLATAVIPIVSFLVTYFIGDKKNKSK